MGTTYRYSESNTNILVKPFCRFGNLFRRGTCKKYLLWYQSVAMSRTTLFTVGADTRLQPSFVCRGKEAHDNEYVHDGQHREGKLCPIPLESTALFIHDTCPLEPRLVDFVLARLY